MTRKPDDTLAALPPWDAAPFFQTPKETNFPLAANGDLLAPADPNRIGIIFASSGMTTAYVTTRAPGMAIWGVPIANNFPALTLLFRDWGSLVQQAFYCSLSFGNANITVIEVRLKEWPRSKAKPRV